MKPRDMLVHATERLARFRKVNKEAATFGQMHYVVERRRLIQELRIDLVLDVGANTGQFARNLRRFYDGDIISFEPVGSAYATLAAAAQADPRWQARKLALGAAAAKRTIHVSRKSVFSSFFRTTEYCQTKFSSISDQLSEEMVEVRRLDEVLPELLPDWAQRRIFLKMDTQGFDVEVFAGAGHVLDAVVALQSEVSLIPIYHDMPHWTEAVRAYEAGGFSIAGLFPVSYDGMRVIEFDCLMVKGDAGK